MRLTGLGVSPGIGVGKALVLKGAARDLQFGSPPPSSTASSSGSRKRGSDRAGRSSRSRHRIARSGGAEHAYIFDAQLLMLDDAMLIGPGGDDHPERAAERGVGAPARARRDLGALRRGAGQLSARAQGRRRRRGRPAVHEPAGGDDPSDLFDGIEGPLVLVADEITPSVIAQLDWQRLAALVTDAGSWTYHTAILARSIHVPAVAGLHDASAPDRAGRAGRGRWAHRRSVRRARRRHARAGHRQAAAAAGLRGDRSSRSADCRRSPRTASQIRLEANVESPGRRGASAGEGRRRASGCSDRSSCSPAADHAALTEETPVCRVPPADGAAAPRAGSRSARSTSARHSCGCGHAAVDGARAPLGLRGIRLSLAMDDMFQAQLRALLRAAAHGPLRIMFPFVSGLEQLRAARAAVERAADDAARARADARATFEIGVMIEVPSAAVTADLLAERSGFLQHRHERSDPVLSGRRSHRRSRRRACTSRCTRRSCGCMRMVARAGRRARHPGRRVRRDGGRPGAAGAARRARPARSSAWRRARCRSRSRCSAACTRRRSARGGAARAGRADRQGSRADLLELLAPQETVRND